MLLPTLILILDVLKATGTATPSIDCAKATQAVERLICSDAPLGGQDGEMFSLYTAALRDAQDKDRSAQQARQSSWVEARDACARAPSPRDCIAGQYARRITELKIRAAQLPVLASARYLCKGHESTPLAVAYYQSDPPAALVSYLDQQVVAFVAESGSGARYTADNLQIWEHQGTATFTWHGEEMACTKG